MTQTNLNIEFLSEETKTEISIPNDKDGKLRIVGDSTKSINKALTEIHSLIGFIREKNVALQFTAIPLLSSEIQSNFEKFKVRRHDIS